MLARPSDSELDDVKEHLLLFKDESLTKLPLAQHDPSTETQFAALAADARFSDLPFAVIQYDELGQSRCFLHKPDENWDIGSAGKLSIATAAVTLLRDVRSMTLAGVIDSNTASSKIDALLRHVWSRHAEPKIKILKTGAHFPLPSIMFEVSATDVAFRGINSVNFTALHSRPTLPPDGRITPAALGKLTFGDRLHLTMGFSDNLAARSCQGTVGIGFINAVCGKLGLFDDRSGKGMKIAGPYAPKHPDLPAGWRHPAGISPRAQARASLRNEVDGRPYVATTRSLATLMSAIMTDTFLDFEMSEQFRQLLLVRPEGYGSHALNAVITFINALPSPPPPHPPPLTESFSKIGVLWSNAEITHMNFGDRGYSLIILGLLDKNGVHWQTRAGELAVEVFKEIMMPP